MDYEQMQRAEAELLKVLYPKHTTSERHATAAQLRYRGKFIAGLNLMKRAAAAEAAMLREFGEDLEDAELLAAARRIEKAGR